MSLPRRSVRGKILRRGYTSGTCAAAATKAATELLLSGLAPETVEIQTPSGFLLELEVLHPHVEEGRASCAIRKDAGDDPDVTDGLLIYSAVEKISEEILFLAGEGVGIARKPGLDPPPGEAAINSVPREMMRSAVTETAKKYGYSGGFRITISAPGGEEIARKTFNPKLGIEGGISIIGTSGIVEPMSLEAILETVRLEMRQLPGRDRLLLTPGNYGEHFARETLSLPMDIHISCSNFIGESLDIAGELGFKEILLVGHIGKMVKLGIGLMNTHSSFGDGRIETLLACALEAGAQRQTLLDVSRCLTSDAAMEVLSQAELLEPTMKLLKDRVQSVLERRVLKQMGVGFVCFSKTPQPRVLFESDNAKEMMQRWKRER